MQPLAPFKVANLKKLIKKIKKKGDFEKTKRRKKLL